MYLSFPNSQGKKQKETPLSSGKKKPRIIDLTKSEQLGASVREKLERELKFDTEKDLRTNATRLYYASTHKETLNVHVAMMPYLAEVSLNTNGEIVLHRTPVNHNLLSPQLAREITNNIYKNPMQTDLTTKTHNESMGKDMHCILTCNKKVRPTVTRPTCSLSITRKNLSQEASHPNDSILPASLIFLQIVEKRVDSSGPNKDVEAMKYVSINASKTKGFGNIFPKKTNQMRSRDN